MWRDYWLSLSFANLVYLRAWADLLPISSEFLFNRKRIPGINLYLAIAGDVLALSLLTFLLIRLAPKLPVWLRQVFLIAAAAMVALALRSIAPAGLRHSALFGLPFAAIVLVVLISLGLRFSGLIARWAQAVALTAIPCIAVTFAGSLFYLRSQTPLPPEPPLASRLAGTPPTRVLWILFDEWDQRLSFPDRAQGIQMPSIDHLAANSFTGTRALAPQAGIPVYQMATVIAIPSLFYGRRVLTLGTESPLIQHLNFATGQSVVLGEGDSIFARVRAQGWNSAIAGWYLPYCRVFNPELTDCYWEEMYEQWLSARPDFAGAAIDETRMLFETRMFSIFGPSIINVRHVAEYQALRAAALRYAADPSLGLAFIHFNIPHVPYFYDPKIGRLGHYGNSDALYNAALQQVDRTVDEILAALVKAGLDSKTAIILSADHPLRTSASQDPYVPFIVHIPGDVYGVAYEREFSTLRTPDLALAIARGEVKSSADVQKFVTNSK